MFLYCHATERRRGAFQDEEKGQVSQKINSCGRASQSFITTGTVNKKIYHEECLKKRLLPFLRSHDALSLFWPDLASCHYAKEWNGIKRMESMLYRKRRITNTQLPGVATYRAVLGSREERTLPLSINSTEEVYRSWTKYVSVGEQRRI